jgi:hypothetical protein
MPEHTSERIAPESADLHAELRKRVAELEATGASPNPDTDTDEQMTRLMRQGLLDTLRLLDGMSQSSVSEFVKEFTPQEAGLLRRIADAIPKKELPPEDPQE